MHDQGLVLESGQPWFDIDFLPSLGYLTSCPPWLSLRISQGGFFNGSYIIFVAAGV